MQKTPLMMKPLVASGRQGKISRIVIYAWVLPTSSLALPLVLANQVAGGQCFQVDGVLEVQGPAVRWLLKRELLSAAALTLGHVVLYQDELARERFRAHETVHVRQAERWGPLFIPLYLLLGFVSWRRSGSAYWNHPWEVEAREKAGF